MPTVTGLREDRRGRVAIELDGAPWRVLPVDVVVRAGLVEGRSLDRAALRTVRRELRRSEALAVAARALHTRDLTRQELQARLLRRGVDERLAGESVAALQASGLVDDARLAHSRAARLAERGYGDAAIRHDLELRGVVPELVEEAVQGLESETIRALPIIEERGPGPRTARYLAARGFAADTVEDAAGREFGQGA